MAGIPVFMSADDNYLPYVACAMASVLYNTRESVSFFIMHDDTVSGFHKRQVAEFARKYENCTVEFLEINVEKHFGQCQRAAHFTLNTFSRLLIPELKPELDKAVYLDCDAIFLGDAAELWRQDTQGCGVAAVRENYFGKEYLQGVLGLPETHVYFNAGVLLVDCAWWRKNNSTETLLGLAEQWADRTKWVDQCILNMYFAGRYRELDGRFNLRRPGAEGYRGCVVRHWAGLEKPWNEYTGKFCNFEDFWFFMKLTPFYEGALARFIAMQIPPPRKKTWIRVFGIKVLKIQKGRARLFGTIPIASVNES